MMNTTCQPPPTPPPNGHIFDVIIVGAGVVGSALATTLGNQGRSVLLLERDFREPDRIVGELLQPGGMKCLRELGLQSCVEGIDAVPVLGYEVIYHGDQVTIPYIKSNKENSEGRSFHHGKFVMSLRSAALRTRNVSAVEANVTNLVRNKYTSRIIGVECKRSGESHLSHFFGRLNIVVDGCFSKFRRQVLQGSPQVRSHFVGMVLKDAPLPSPNFGHVVIGNQAPVLLYQIGSRDTRILVDVPGKLPSASDGSLSKYLHANVLKELPSQLHESFLLALSSERLRTMPNSFLPSSFSQQKGVAILGDAMNMRHPLTGGGMTVGLHDAVLISRLLSPEVVPDLNDCDLVLSQLRKLHHQRKQLSSVINVLAQALYSLFAANDKRLRALQLGCFRYFQLGGPCINGPVGLLSGITRRPFLLLFHFFAVALYAIYLMFASAYVYMYPSLVAESVGVFWKACTVILPFVWAEVSG